MSSPGWGDVLWCWVVALTISLRHSLSLLGDGGGTIITGPGL